MLLRALYSATDPSPAADNSYVALRSDAYGNLRVSQSSVESSGNSSTDTLAGDATFTGTAELNDYDHVGVSCYSDTAGTLYFDFSIDGTNWRTFPTIGFSVEAGVHEFHTAIKLRRYFRTRFANGSNAQSTFQLKTYYGNHLLPSNVPLNQSVGLDHDAIMTRSTLADDEIVLGRRSGVTPWNKFGYNNDIDSTAEEVIASFGGTFTPMTSAETFTIAYNNATDGAGGGTTGATQLTFYYIDSNGTSQIATHTLGSSGSDTTSFTGLGINRCAVSASGSSNSNVNDITITATTATTNQAQIPAGKGVTQQCIFFVDSNSKAVVKFIKINVRKLAGGSAPRVTIRGVVFNRNIETNFEVLTVNIDTAIDNHVIFTEPVGFRLNETDVFYFVASTNTNDTIFDARFSLVEYENI